MSLARGLSNYATAGGQHANDDRFGVNARVYVPDGDAGTACAECFKAVVPVRKRRMSVSRNAALIYLGAVIFSCLLYLGSLSIQSRDYAKDLAAVENAMRNDAVAIETLTAQVKKNTDPSRICVKAVEFGMVASAEENTQHIYLNEIEQFTKAANQKDQMTAAAELPLLGVQAHLTGSR